MDLGALPRRRQLPVAVEVAVPVQPAAKTGFAVGLSEIGDVGFADPIRQRFDGADVAEKALAFGNEHYRGIGNATPEQLPHGERDVTLEFRFGNAGRLEILPIEIGDAALPQALQRPAAAAEWRGHAEARDLCEHVRAELRRVPGDRRAPIMTDDDGLFLAKG